MYSKFISIAFVLAATLAPTSAVVLPRGDNEPTSSHASLCTTTTFSGGHSLVQTAPCTAKTSQHLHVRDDPKLATATPVITPTATPTVTPTLTATPTVTPTLAATPATTHTPSVTPSATSTSPTTPLPTTTRPATTSPSTTITPSITPTPATSVTPTAQPTDTSKSNGSPSKASTSSCNDVQPWQDNLAYSAGAQVIFKNQLWTANQWSYNNNPESAAGAWTLNGVCNPPIINKVDCTGVPAWNQPTAYPGGSKVTFNGHLWISTQWTQSNKPGDTSGTWKDLGVCL